MRLRTDSSATSVNGYAVEATGLVCGHVPEEPILSDLELSLPHGRTAALVGRSGSGKTTLLRTLLGILPPLAGWYTALTGRPGARAPAGAIGYIPQGLGLVRNRSVLSNVLIGLLHEAGRARSLTARFTPAHVERAREALSQVGLAAKQDERPIRLSGGERRRVAVARAIAQRPKLLLADETLSELDEMTREEIVASLGDLQRATGTAILMVEHDIDLASEVADVVCCVAGGTIVESLERTPDRGRLVREAVRADVAT